LHHVELAWALVDVARGHMKAAERMDVCVAIGGGDEHIAIRRLTPIVVREHLPVPKEVSDALRNWWAAHSGDADQLTEVIATPPQPRPVPAIPATGRYLSVVRQYRRPVDPVSEPDVVCVCSAKESVERTG
jgi:hypothetical protein